MKTGTDNSWLGRLPPMIGQMSRRKWEDLREREGANESEGVEENAKGRTRVRRRAIA